MERKILSLANAKVGNKGPGTISGYASVFNGIDSYRDTVVPGAYARTLPKFLKDGFVAWSHDWGVPIATPEKAYEDAKGLYLEAEFHTDPDAQRFRRLAAERLARGKSLGLSIGYEAKQFDYAELNGQEVRRLLDIELMEVSLVMVPADDAARVGAVKRAGTGGRPLPTPERAELRLIFARVDEQRARERREHAELACSVERTLTRTAHVAGGRRRGR